jgi:hypothetical protein
MSATFSFVDDRQVLTVIQPTLPLHECADPAPAESATEPLHSATGPAAAKFATEPLQSIANSDAAADAPTETSCSQSCNINESYNRRQAFTNEDNHSISRT